MDGESTTLLIHFLRFPFVDLITDRLTFVALFTINDREKEQTLNEPSEGRGFLLL